jgi:DNA ligase (NAD+)
MNKERIKELATKIDQARNDYYNSESKISDKVFDAWIGELKVLDPNNKAITAIGAPVIQSEWKKAKHQIPMGSLDKVNTPEELIDWAKDKPLSTRTKAQWFVVEKLDGLSIEVIYEHGKLVQAITRGDGVEGDDTTANVKRMTGVNNDLKEDFTGSLRGEIIMRKSIHQEFFSDKTNPRNAAVGVSKRLDGVNVDKLDVFFYQVLGEADFASEIDQFVWLKKHKLGCPNYWSFQKDKEVNNFWRNYQDNDRAKLDYEIDGIVVRLNDLADQISLGDKDLRPKGATAFKFDNETRESVLREVIFQVGNSGRVCPVAVVDPVILVGASITRASLYNMAYVNELGLDIGATVLVARANDVIPRIEELVKGTGTILKAPTKCPECSSKLLMQGEHLMCLNYDCPAQVIGRVKNWIKEIGILEWGDTLIEKLVASELVNDLSDLYTLTVDELASIDRMGKKSAQKCFDNLWAAKEVPLEVLLGGLSIPMIGQSTIKAIMSAGYTTLDQFLELEASDFEKVSGVGPTKSQSLYDGLQNNKELIMKMIDNGVEVKEPNTTGKLAGKSFCFTGALSIKRAEAEKMVAEQGGEAKNSVGRGLTYLVIADPSSTSSKAQKARSLGIQLINEATFLSMVE